MKVLIQNLLAFFVLGTISPLPFVSSARTFVVSPKGNDAHRGTFEEPLRTISSGARRANPGDIVFVLEGTYRERVTPMRGGEKGKRVIYRAEPGKRVYIKGSEIWQPTWKKEGDGIYSAEPADDLFNDRSGEYLDGHNPFMIELASTPYQREGRKEERRRQAGDQRIHHADKRIIFTCGQIFVEGRPFQEVPLQEELIPGSWWYRKAQNRVYIHFDKLDPSNLKVEITTRRRLFAPIRRGLGYITVEGFIFEHCGNQYPTDFWIQDENAQKGAVGTEAGHHWIIRRNVIRYCKTFAIDCGRVDQHSPTRSTSFDNLIEKNYIIDNGSAGILSYGSRDLTLRGNVILRNNYLKFSGIKRWEQGGIKCHKMENGLIEGNYIAYNHHSPGIWLDNEFPDSRISRNVIHDNGTQGLFLEMSDYDFDSILVDQNLIFSNAESAVYIHDASGATFANNILASNPTRDSNNRAIQIKQVSKRTRSQKHSFFNNLILGNSPNIEVNYPAFKGGPQKFDHNLYGVEMKERNFVINAFSDQPTPWSSEAFTRRILEDLKLKKMPTSLVNSEKRIALNFQEWKKFWNHHQLKNDQNSQFISNITIGYEANSHVLTIEHSAESQIGDKYRARSEKSLIFDCIKQTFLEDPPGPFTHAMLPRESFNAWNGLPHFSEGDLPKRGWTLLEGD